MKLVSTSVDGMESFAATFDARGQYLNLDSHHVVYTIDGAEARITISREGPEVSAYIVRGDGSQIVGYRGYVGGGDEGWARSFADHEGWAWPDASKRGGKCARLTTSEALALDMLADSVGWDTDRLKVEHELALELRANGGTPAEWHALITKGQAA